MVRTILTPRDTHIELDIPAEYVGKKIEITYLALDELNEKPPKTMSEFWGILSDKTSSELHKEIEKSRAEWDRNI
ncbi:hypothetical protein ACPPVU_01015 [Mucilaginibacter sp. McL0603]|uniref:hypothetical protein n=1 Tax=Mucilaginibacter sp. McL0603 TaxID=3415670 RepID=UPI003CE8F507